MRNKKRKWSERKLLIKTLKEKMSRYPNWVSMCPKSTAATRRMRNILLHTSEGAATVCWHFLRKTFPQKKRKAPALNNSAVEIHANIKAKMSPKTLDEQNFIVNVPLPHILVPLASWLSSSLALSKSLVNFLGNCLQQAFNCLAASWAFLGWVAEKKMGQGRKSAFVSFVHKLLKLVFCAQW